MATLKRIGGCNQTIGILGLLFDGNTIPVRLTSCKNKLTPTCSLDKCQRYRTGTIGSTKISWDKPGARI